MGQKSFLADIHPFLTDHTFDLPWKHQQFSRGVSKANTGRKWVIKLLYFTTSYKIVIIKFLESLHNLPFHDRADVDASISFLISLSNNADAKEVDFVWKRNKTCSKF